MSNKNYNSEPWLREQYEALWKSQRELARECNCNARTISSRLKKFNIKIRSPHKNYNIEDLCAEAAKRNGECLSEEYTPKQNQLWRCEFGHEWSALWENIRAGGWCQTCYLGSKPGIGDAKKLAREHGGYCLTSEYINNKTKMLFTCSFGHTWEVSYNRIQSGKWCPICHSDKRVREGLFRNALEELFHVDFPKHRPEWLISRHGKRLELDGYNRNLEIAFEHQGKQHFEIVEWFGVTEGRLARIQQNDEDKARIVKEHGITLLTPIYNLNPNKFAEYIIESLAPEQLESAYIN